MAEVMIDLETMGTAPGSVIAIIGAVKFDVGGITDEFLINVNMGSCLEVGMVMDPATVKWWMSQSDMAREQFFKPSFSIHAALSAFSEWVGKPSGVWGNGADFDNALLADAYRKCGIPIPWHFGQSRCYRTVKNICSDVAFERSGTHHNALDDARSQAVHLIKCLGQLSKASK